jgi:hypothetical protein
MITNEQYLVQRFAEALQKYNSNGDNAHRKYWAGVTDTYQNLLNEAFPGWADPGTVGWHVLNGGLSYDAALSKEGPGRSTERDPEVRHWNAVNTWAERHSYVDWDGSDEYDC